MPTFTSDDVELAYEEAGAGFPLILFAPGGMHSVMRYWHTSPADPSQRPPWISPITDLSADFRVIAMDQRNAGGSRGPVGDGWPTYTADHLALLDHLGVDRTHAMGGCIGSSYSLALIQAAPERVAAAVLQNPIGRTPDNGPMFKGMVDNWADELGRDEQAARALADKMFGGDFVFTVDRDFVSRCPVPLLVLAGDDAFHPTAVAEEIVDLAPAAELVRDWKGRHQETADRVRSFLKAHTP